MALWILILSTAALYAEENAILALREPDYRWSASLQVGYFNPEGDYAAILDNAPLISLGLSFNPEWIDHLLLQWESSFAFSNFRYSPDTRYQFLATGIGPHYQFPLFGSLYFSPGIQGGFYNFSLSDKKSTQNFYARGSLELLYEIFPELQISASAHYHFLYDSLKSLKGLSWNAGFTYILGTRHAHKDLQLTRIETKKIFAALYPLYHQQSLGVVTIKNTTDKPIYHIQASVRVNNFMSSFFKTPFTIPALMPGKEAHLPISFLFDHHIAELTSQRHVSGILELEYVKADHKRYTKQNAFALTLFPRNALVWDDVAKVGSFITHTHPQIVSFTRHLLNIKLEGEFGIELLNILKIITGLRAMRITYVSDPSSSYTSLSGQDLLMDYLQLPIETLLRASGDCDDLSVLLAALLESIGIETAFVAVPGHIFLLAALPRAFSHPKLISFQNKLWLPLETTAIMEGVSIAWEKGFQNYEAHAQKTIILSSRAMEKYPPLTHFPDLEKKFNPEKISLEKWESYAKEDQLSLQQILNPGKNKKELDDDYKHLSPSKLNEKGISFCENKMWDLCENYYLLAQKKDPHFNMSYYNLIILYKMRDDVASAKRVLKQLLSLYPHDLEGQRIFSSTKEK